MCQDRISNISSVAGRKKAVLELKERIGSRLFSDKKATTISKSIIKRVNELADGKVFERIDFEKIKADKDKLPKEKAKGAASGGSESVQPIVDAAASAASENESGLSKESAKAAASGGSEFSQPIVGAADVAAS